MRRLLDWLKRLLPWLFIALFLVCPDAIAKDVVLSWDKSPTATVTGYWIYVGENKEVVPYLRKIDAGNALTKKVRNLIDIRDYWFAVTAYDADGNESVYSNIVHSEPKLRQLNIDVEVIPIK